MTIASKHQWAIIPIVFALSGEKLQWWYYFIGTPPATPHYDDGGNDDDADDAYDDDDDDDDDENGKHLIWLHERRALKVYNRLLCHLPASSWLSSSSSKG